MNNEQENKDIRKESEELAEEKLEKVSGGIKMSRELVEKLIGTLTEEEKKNILKP